MSSRAAERIREELRRAKEGNYLRNGWYAYISREDVEAVLTGYENALHARTVDMPLTTKPDGHDNAGS